MLHSEIDRAALLDAYAKVCRGERVAADHLNPVINELRLSGIVRVVDGFLRVRNQIYARVFDRKWVRDNCPMQNCGGSGMPFGAVCGALRASPSSSSPSSQPLPFMRFSRGKRHKPRAAKPLAQEQGGHRSKKDRREKPAGSNQGKEKGRGKTE